MNQSFYRWLDPQPLIIPSELDNHFSESPYLAEALFRRGISSIPRARQFLNPSHYQPTAPEDFPGTKKAVEMLDQSLQKGKQIGVWGDFDVDGQTATTLLVGFLHQIGARVRYHIPNREQESHGIRLQPLQEFIAQGIDLLLTCDTGISEFEAAEYLKQQGIPLIITDHHDLPQELPPAETILNPHFLEINHPFHGLSGVGTAFQIVRLFSEEKQLGLDFKNELVDLVALGTVADLAPLVAENRYYVQNGLISLQSGQRLAIQKLLEVGGYQNLPFNEETISYIIAPRMNAIGRLQDANVMVEFLLSEENTYIEKIALQLEDLNNQRKLLVNQVYKSAVKEIRKNPTWMDDPILVIDHPNWPGGVVGIVASRLVEEYQKPGIILTNLTDGSSRGSARSIQGLDIHKAIEQCNDLLISSGGHAMAAGLAIQTENIPLFRHRIIQTIQQMCPQGLQPAALAIDAYLPLNLVNERLMQSITQLAPFGQGNPKPAFVTQNLHVIESTYIGKTQEHKRLVLQDEHGNSNEALWWNAADKPLPSEAIDVAYTLRQDSYRGTTKTILEWIDYRLSEPSKIAIQSKYLPAIFDNRYKKERLFILDILQSEPDTIIYYEGIDTLPYTTNNRNTIRKTNYLVIQTIPPSIDILQNILEVSKAGTIYFSAENKAITDTTEFLKFFSGLVKFVLTKKQGETNLGELAVACGHTEQTILHGLNWLQAHGDIQYQECDDGQIEILSSGSKDQRQVKVVGRQLRQVLEETAAFQRFYLQADLRNFFQ